MGFASQMARFFGEGDLGFDESYKPLGSRESSSEALWSYLPYETYESHTQLFLNRGSTGFVLKGLPSAGATLSDQEKLDTFFAHLGHLPEGSALQFLLVASPRIQKRLESWKASRVHPHFGSLGSHRYAYLLDRAFDGQFPLRTFSVLISYTCPGVLSNPLERESLLQVRRSLQESLERIGIWTDVLDDRALVQEVSELINIDTTTAPETFWWSDQESLSKLIPASDFAGCVHPDGLFLKNKKLVAHSFLPHSTPKHWALAHMDKLFGDALEGRETIPCPFFIHYGLYVSEGQGRQKKRAVLKREGLEGSLRSRLKKWQPTLEEDFEEACEIVKELQKGERIVEACLSLTTFCAPSDLSKVKSSVDSIWRTHGWGARSARYGHLNLFLSSLPMMWSAEGESRRLFSGKRKLCGAGPSLCALGLTRRTITKESQNLLPVVAEWVGQKAPGIPLQGRRGQLAFWSPFDGLLIPGQELNRPTGNYNFCITGISGSGKSFLCNELIMTTIAVGGRSFVLDKGGSFKNLCHALRGHHLHFDGSRPFSVNPFTHIPEGDCLEDRKDREFLFKGLLSVVTQMAFPSGLRESIQEAFLKEAIYAVWESKKSQGRIEDIRAYLQGQEDSRAQDCARLLIDFGVQGAYGGLFNPPADMDLNHELVVVETDTLEEPLKSVMVMMMMVQVWQRMIRSDRKAPFLILIDEGWDLLRGKSTGDFMEALALTARKYRCSLGVATQSLSHFFKEGSPGPKAAWENSAWKVIFTQEADTLSGLKDHPQLGEYVKSGYRETLLRSLSPARGFSEFALFHTELPGVVLRLFCDPYTTLLYSTHAQEVATLNDLQASGLTLEQAIHRVLTQRGGNA